MTNANTSKKYFILAGFPTREMWDGRTADTEEEARQLFEEVKAEEIRSEEYEKRDSEHWFVELEEETTPLDEDGDPIECRAEYETIEMFDVTQYLEDEEERKEEEKKAEILAELEEVDIQVIKDLAYKYAKGRTAYSCEYTDDEKINCWAKDGDKFIECCNSTGHCWIEEFDTLEDLHEDYLSYRL